MKQALGLALVVLLVGCSAPSGVCGGETCTESQRCDADSLRCVEDLAPVISLSIPTEVVSSATLELSGSVTDDVAIVSAEWRLGDGAWAPLSLDASGAFSLTADAPSLDTATVGVSIRVRDAKQESTEAKQVRVDRVGPTITLVAPDAGTLHSGASIALTVRLDDGSNAIGSLKFDDAGVAAMPGLTTSSISVPPTANFQRLEVAVAATDAYGNLTTTTFGFLGDRVSPNLAIVTPAPMTTLTTATTTVTFTATDPGEVVSATCSTGSGATSMAVLTGTQGSCELPLEEVERAETIGVTAVDAAGNAATQTVTVNVDRIAPTVTITAPTAAALLAQATTVNVTTTRGAVGVLARFGGTMFTLTESAPGSGSWTGQVTPPSRDYGAEVLVVEARDVNGAVGTAQVSVFVDTVAPVLTITEPSANQRFNASNFSAGNDVRTSWTVVDADPMARTETVDGSASTATSVLTPSSPTDNPRAYSHTITAIDRAGNRRTATVSYSVDRVVPTLASWTPATGTRTVFPRVTNLTFSEPVVSPSGCPVRLVSSPSLPGGSWPAASSFSIPLDDYALQAIELTLAPDLADAHGNAPAGATRRLHLGTGFARGTNLILATNVTAIDAAVDSDGVLTIGAISGTNLVLLRDVGSAFMPVATGAPNFVSSFAVNSWNVVNPTTLASSPRFSVSGFGGTAFRYWNVDGVGMSEANTSVSAVVTVPPLGNSTPATAPWEGTSAPIGVISGDAYSRLRSDNSTASWTVGFPAGSLLQSATSWILPYAPSGARMQWGRFYCSYTAALGRFCDTYVTQVMSAGLSPMTVTRVQGGITRTGSCAVFTWNASGVHNGFAQARPACETNGSRCSDLPPDFFSATQLSNTGDRVGTFDANGEDTLILSRRDSSGVGVLEVVKLTGCSFSQTSDVAFGPLDGLSVLGFLTLHLPVRVGNDIGLLYTDSTNTLRLEIQQ